MNNIKFFLVFILFCILTVYSCNTRENKTTLKSRADTVSYYWGLLYGSNLKESNVDSIFDFKLFQMGFDDVLTSESDTTSFSNYAIQTYLNLFLDEYELKELETRYRHHIAENKAFLDENSRRDSVVTLPSGIQYIVLKEGTGEKPRVSDVVKLHFSSFLIDGTKLDNTKESGEPYVIRVNNTIPGWIEILQMMPVGSKWRVFVPAELAFGSNTPNDSIIKPFSTLIYEIELLEVNAD